MTTHVMEEEEINQQYVLPVRAFSTEEDLTKSTVLRYLTLEKFQSLLELQAVWFSRLGALQDEFEGTIPNGARAKLLALSKDPEAEKRLGSHLLTHMLNVASNGSSAPARIGVIVTCWFLGHNESEKMWREYGQGGKGVAIRSTVNRLCGSFHITGDYVKISAVGRVQYVNFEAHQMDFRDANHVNRVALIKDKSFEHEQEVRVLTTNSIHSGCLNPSGDIIFNPNRSGLYIKCALQNLLQAVVVGPNAQSDLIEQLITKHRLSFEIEKSQLSPFQS